LSPFWPSCTACSNFACRERVAFIHRIAEKEGVLGNSKSIRAKGKPVGHVLLAFKAISYL
jgi:hypothetical protein